MEIPAAIAGKLAEFTVEPIGRQVGYLAHYKSNYQNLQSKVEDLRAARDEVQHKVDEVESSGKRIETSVRNWKSKVDAIITDAETFLNDGRHAQTECLHGFCPHLVLCYQLSKKSTKLVKEIVELYGKKEFSNFAFNVRPQEVFLLSTGHYSTFDSRNSIVMRVMDELRNPNTEMILVYGIGGVGKTTLVEEVLRKAKDDNLFDDVVMVRDVKENLDLEKIQKEIAMKLGMSIDENHTLAQRAPLLGDRIKQKRTLVVLDDVWEEIDLLAVGVPRLATCKVVLTCRSRKELSLDRRTQTDISLDVLNEEETWSLFEKMAGDVVKDSRIRSIAIEIAKKCGGLPVLIVTVARALKDRNKLQVWKDTLRRLRGFDNKELTEKAYSALEWSYDQLEDKELKPLFLLCGIIVVKNHISLADLLRYGFGLGLIKNVDTIEEARDALDTLVEKLKDSCLLLDSDINMHVRMHDLVCEVATRIASREHHVLSVGYGGELKEWPEKDFFERCSKMSLKSSNIPMLSEVPWKCPKLEMFHLYREGWGDARMEFPSNFFSEMEKLKVLGLTKVRRLSLPSSLQFLKNLQTLCLEGCRLFEENQEIALVGHLCNLEILSFSRSNIKQLPEEIGQLTRLRWLDLSDCDELEVISPNVISRLERLEDLSLRNVFLKWEAERGGSNASLLELKDLSQLTALEIYIEDANILPSNLFSSNLVRYQICIGDVWNDIFYSKNTMAETTLNTLKLKLAPSDELDHGIKTLLKRSEDLSLDGTESVNSILRQVDVEDFQQLIHLRLRNNVDFTFIIDRKVVFPNLTTLSICSCDHLSFLFSFSMAKSLVELKYLEVSRCEIMEEIVSARDQSNGENIDIMFCKLESLILDELPNITRFYLGIIASKWPLLKQVNITRCGKVKMFAAELPISSERHEPNPLIEQSLFLIDQDSFPNLEELILEVAGEIWYGPSSPAHFFPKLKSIRFFKWARFSKQAAIHFLEKLPNLDRIEVGCDDVSTEIFVNEEINGGEEIHALGTTLSAVKTLTVIGMPKLLQLGNNGNSQTAGPLFPNLDTLEVRFCGMLKSVESSAISFRNLTTLSVLHCDGLEYLTSYSVAKSLMRLTTLDVMDCKSLRAIIGASNEDDHDTGGTCEIAFSRLQHLTLVFLPELQGFCSGNCIVKLPSSTELKVLDCPIELKISSEGVLLSNPKPERVQIAKPEIAEEVDDNDDGEKEKDDDVGTSRQDIEDRQE